MVEGLVARISQDVSGRSILSFIRSCVSMKDSELMTDEYKAYQTVGKYMKHTVINHQIQYAKGDKHTNTIEGFWSLLKRAWYGTHYHYQSMYAPLYIAEGCYRYNNRNVNNIFGKFVNESMR